MFPTCEGGADHQGVYQACNVSSSLPHVEKEEQSPLSEAWDVDEGLISKLKEQYKKERKGKKGVKSKSAGSSFTRRLLFLYFYTSSGEPISDLTQSCPALISPQR